MATLDDDVITRTMAYQGFTTLTPIQQLTISHIVRGESIIIESPPKTGKTTLVCLQILQNINPNIKDCQALIITNSHMETDRLFALLKSLSVINSNIICKLFKAEDANHQDIELMGYHVVVASAETSKNLCNLCIYNLRTVVLKEVTPSQVPRLLQKTGDKAQMIVTTSVNLSDAADNCQLPVFKLPFRNVGFPFDQLKGPLAGKCTEQLKKLGYDTAVKLQKLTFESCVKKKSLIIQGPGGSGKTTAGVCVLLAQQFSSEIKGCQAVIITDTQASVMFIERLLSRLSKNANWEYGVCGQDNKKMSMSNIIVGTAENVGTVLASEKFSKMQIKTFFLDDADKFFGQQTYTVSQLLKQDKQIIISTTSNITVNNLSNYRQTLFVKLPSDPDLVQAFSDMIILQELLKNITDIGCSQPTPIQHATIVRCAQGESMIVQAPSSTGKTTAICISVLQRLLLNILRCQVLIITNSDASVMKIYSLLRRLMVKCPCKILQCTASVQHDLRKLKGGYRHIVVGTVWQIKNLLQQNKCFMIHLKIVVLDPADVIMEQSKMDWKKIAKCIGAPDQIILSTNKMESFTEFENISIVDLSSATEHRDVASPSSSHTEIDVHQDDAKALTSYNATENAQFQPHQELATTFSAFSDMNLSDQLLLNIAKAGLKQPLLIQQLTIPLCLEGKPMIMIAPRASGKTTAICIALLQKIDVNVKRCQALIITASTQAAIETERIMKKLLEGSKIQCYTCMGGLTILEEAKKTDAGFQIIIGTDIRIKVLLGCHAFSLHMIEILALDGADYLFYTQPILHQLGAIKQIIIAANTQQNLADFLHLPIIEVASKQKVSLSEELVNSFVDMNISSNLLLGLQELGITKPYVIQKKSIPVLLSGRSVILEAPIGTGKTIAILSAVLENINFSVPECQAIIFTSKIKEMNELHKTVMVMGKHLQVSTFEIRGNTELQECSAQILFARKNLTKLNLLNLRFCKMIVFNNGFLQKDFSFFEKLKGFVGKNLQIILSTSTRVEEEKLLAIADFTKVTVTMDDYLRDENSKNAFALCDIDINLIGDLKLSDKLLRGITDYGYVIPVLFQQRLMLPCLESKSMVILAKADTEIRVALCIALLQSINTQIQQCQVLFIAMTPEAATKIKQILLKLAAYLNVSIGVFIWKESELNERYELHSGCQIVVGTLGRINNLLTRKLLTLKCTKTFVMEDLHWLSEKSGLLNKILEQLRVDAQRIFTAERRTKSMAIYTSNCVNVTFTRHEILNHETIVPLSKEKLTKDQPFVSHENLKKENKATGNEKTESKNDNVDFTKPETICEEIVERDQLQRLTTALNAGVSEMPEGHKDEPGGTDLRRDTEMEEKLEILSNVKHYKFSDIKLLNYYLIERNHPCSQLFIWCADSNQVTALADYLIAMDKSVVTLSTAYSKRENSINLNQFRYGYTSTLIASDDVLAEGDVVIDVLVSVVFNYQLSHSIKDYAKRMAVVVPHGVVVTFETTETKKILLEIEKYYNINIQQLAG